MLSDTNKSIMLSVITECHYADSHCAEYHYAECHCAECHYAKCRGALNTTKTVMALCRNTTRQHSVKRTSLFSINIFCIKQSSLLSFFIIFIF
jgi:hypothetical protein